MGTQVHSEQPSIDRETDPEVIARRTELFNKYVLPFCNMIFKLCKQYSNHPDNVQENYSEVMLNFYRRIETYNPDRPIRAWLHTCIKHQVWACEKKRQSQNKKDCDMDIEDYQDEILDDDHVSSNILGVDNWREHYSPEILEVIDELKPRHRNALILQEAGYTLREIAEIEFKNGSLRAQNMETIKSRLRFARQYLKRNLTRDGKRISRPTEPEDVL